MMKQKAIPLISLGIFSIVIGILGITYSRFTHQSNYLVGISLSALIAFEGILLTIYGWRQQ